MELEPARDQREERRRDHDDPEGVEKGRAPEDQPAPSSWPIGARGMRLDLRGALRAYARPFPRRATLVNRQVAASWRPPVP
jgi:hypothetical protein